MDDQNRPTPADNNPPGAPELGKGVTPPSAPLIDDKFTGPVFRAQPTNPDKPAVAVPAASEPQLQDDIETDDQQPAVDDRQARIEYLQSLRQDSGKKRKKSKLKPFIIGLVGLLIIGAASAGAYIRLHDSGPAKKQSVQTTPQQTNRTSEQPTVDSDQSKTADIKEFTSSTFHLSLSYPGDWTPEELADKLTITSPVVSLANGSGQATSGKIVFSVRPRQDKPAEFAAGKVVAVLASDKVSYAKPSASQRATTYLSYLQYAGTTVKGGLDGIYITGNYGYKYAQVVQLAEISKIDPLIEVSFVSCADTTCAVATQKQLTLSSASWKTDTANRPAVEAMLKSLVL